MLIINKINYFYLKIIANVVGSAEKCFANKSVHADVMDGKLAYKCK